MYIEILQPDGSRQHRFGVSDFEMTKEGVRVGTFSHTGVNQTIRSIDGHVVTAIDEATYNRQGAYETISDLAVGDENSVIVEETWYNREIVSAADQVIQDGAGGSITLVNIDGVVTEV